MGQIWKVKVTARIYQMCGVLGGSAGDFNIHSCGWVSNSDLQARVKYFQQRGDN